MVKFIPDTIFKAKNLWLDMSYTAGKPTYTAILLKDTVLNWCPIIRPIC